MVGQVLGAVGGLPQIFTELEVSYYLLKRLLGVRTEGDKKGAKVAKLSKSEVLMVNIGSLSTGKLPIWSLFCKCNHVNQNRYLEMMSGINNTITL